VRQVFQDTNNVRRVELRFGLWLTHVVHAPWTS
jgi:hypothetical protein